jgi:hypothetical protein
VQRLFFGILFLILLFGVTTGRALAQLLLEKGENLGSPAIIEITAPENCRFQHETADPDQVALSCPAGNIATSAVLANASTEEYQELKQQAERDPGCPIQVSAEPGCVAIVVCGSCPVAAVYSHTCQPAPGVRRLYSRLPDRFTRLEPIRHRLAAAKRVPGDNYALAGYDSNSNRAGGASNAVYGADAQGAVPRMTGP